MVAILEVKGPAGALTQSPSSSTRDYSGNCMIYFPASNGLPNLLSCEPWGYQSVRARLTPKLEQRPLAHYSQAQRASSRTIGTKR